MAVVRAGSILAVDFGSAHTRALLIDLIEGVYRVIAHAETRTTSGFPWGDISVGLYRAIDQIAEMTDRTLVNENGRVLTPEQLDRSGVDTFITTASIGRPLRTVLLGLVPSVSVASALRATAGTYVHVVETITLDDVRDEEEQLNALVHSRPDLIFITGGTEDGARDPVLRMARVAALAIPLMSSQVKPTVLYAGNSALVPEIRGLFDGRATLFVAPNVRPSLDDEELESAQMQLSMAFDASSSQRGAGFEQVGAMSRLGILPTAPSYSVIVDYLGKTFAGDVVAVDVGSSVGVLSASLEGQVSTAIRTDIGLGDSASDLVNAVGVSAIQSWLPFDATPDEILTYALNKTLRPTTIPESTRNLYIEHAFLRAALRELVRVAGPAWDPSLADGEDNPLPPFSYLIAAGAALTRTGRPALSAMLLLDALSPVGITTLLADPLGLIPALGAVAHLNPIAVVQVLDTQGLERLGVSFNLSGQPRAGRAAMRAKITPLGGGEPVIRDIEGDSLWAYPLPAGARARVEVWAKGRGLSFGGKRHLKIDVEGGSAGLIFDTRGRPLPLSRQIEGRAQQMPRWLSAITGDALRTIESSPEAPEPAPARARVDAGDARRTRRLRQPEKPQRARPAAVTQDEGDDIDELRDLFS